MFVQFDKNRLHVQVVCGSLEEYVPSEDMKQVQSKVDALKKKLAKFQEETIFPEIKAIEALIEKINPSPSEDK